MDPRVIIMRRLYRHMGAVFAEYGHSHAHIEWDDPTGRWFNYAIACGILGFGRAVERWFAEGEDDGGGGTRKRRPTQEQPQPDPRAN